MMPDDNDKIIRHKPIERINHWAVVICFLFTAISGLGSFSFTKLVYEHFRYATTVANFASICGYGDVLAVRIYVLPLFPS